MRDKFPIIKNRDRCYFRFDTHKLIDLAGADYLTDNDDIVVIFLDGCNHRRASFCVGSNWKKHKHTSRWSERVPKMGFPPKNRLILIFFWLPILEWPPKWCLKSLIQWGFEIRTCSDFKWSIVVGFSNSSDFEWLL